MKISARNRFFYAYSSTALIFLSYLKLALLKRLLGEERLASRIEKTHQRNARRILNAILKLKGLFIKVGQMISIMTNFLPKPLTAGLEALQDSVTPHPYEDIERRIFEEFQQKPEDLFLEFDRSPLASASLGQVHKATLKDGTSVAVKVQYPDIEAIVTVDLKILKRIFSFLHLVFPHYGLKQTYQEVSSIVTQELDFINEGKNLETIQEHFKEEHDFLFSKIYWDFSTRRVLTLQFMEGVKISNLEALKALEISPTEVASKIIHAYCKQIFLDGVYHADPHPGNFLVQPGPKIIMMDFGAVARISDRMRKGTAKFIEGVIRRDHHIISQSMKEMGFISKSQNEEVFDRIVDFFYDRLKDIKMEDVKDLNLSQLGKLEDLIEFKKLDISFKDLLETFNVPKDWALMERAFILIFALTTHLDSKLNPLSIIIPYAEKFVLGSDKTVGDLIVEGVKETGLSYLKLPNELLRTLKRLNQGEIEFRTKNQSTETGPIALALKRLQSTLLFIASLAMTYLLYKEQIPEYRYALYSSAVFAVWWMFTQLKKS